MPINRRHVLAAAAAGLCLPDTAGAADDEPPLIHEDYALARQRFQTHLLERGPAPDQAQPITPPPGARQIRYRSGSLDLVAWISDMPIRVLRGLPCFSCMVATPSGKVTGISLGLISRPAMSR